MPLPEVIPILHEPDYRTRTIGRYRDGQFFASVTSAWPGEPPAYARDTESTTFAYVHLFDHDGQYVRSEFRVIDGGPGEIQRADEVLAELLDQLPDLKYGDIGIRTFRVEYQGVVFGLLGGFDDPDDDDADEDDRIDGDPRADLFPDDLCFHAPWNGEYDT